jgi:uncharacterized membrane protein YkvA (DUF1232 family)
LLPFYLWTLWATQLRSEPRSSICIKLATDDGMAGTRAQAQAGRGRGRIGDAGSAGALAARALGACIVAYALSPIDLIPDFIPVIGYLDDLVLVPLGLLLMLRLIPAEVLAEHRAVAAGIAERPVSYAGAAAVILVWLLSLALAAYWMHRFFVD